MKTALQLYSIRDATARDFRSAAQQVAAMGYQGVELAGYGNLNAAAANDALRENGLSVCGMHVLMGPLSADLSAVAEEAILLGTSRVVCPWFPPSLLTTPAAFEALGERLNAIGETLRGFGLRFLYHHHWFELQRFGERTGLDLLLRACEPRYVGCEIDVYFLHQVGVPIRRLMQEHGGRIELVHLKDEYEIGSGPIDFQAVFSALDAAPCVEWQIVEQERYHGDSLSGARECLDRLRVWQRI